MRLGLAQYTSIEIDKETDFITPYSDELKDYFDNKNYGDDVKHITINTICVSENFEPFFKPKRPKYIRDKKLIENYGFKYEIEKRLIYDVKIDFHEFKNAGDEISRKRILSREILTSLDSDALKPMRKKLKDFDWEGFKRDLEVYFKEKGHL